MARDVWLAAKDQVTYLSETHERTKAEEAKIRTNLENVLREMRSKIEALYQMIHGRIPTEEEFNNLGINMT